MKNEHRIKLPNSNTASSMIATFIATRSACLARSIGSDLPRAQQRSELRWLDLQLQADSPGRQERRR
jgi:hypothetical protein